jgi:hypothetical protein
MPQPTTLQRVPNIRHVRIYFIDGSPKFQEEELMEKLIIDLPVKIFPDIYGTRKFISIVTNIRL